jgi:hypothetical protein
VALVAAVLVVVVVRGSRVVDGSVVGGDPVVSLRGSGQTGRGDDRRGEDADPSVGFAHASLHWCAGPGLPAHGIGKLLDASNAR